jgi:hypothetical protein
MLPPQEDRMTEPLLWQVTDAIRPMTRRYHVLALDENGHPAAHSDHRYLWQAKWAARRHWRAGLHVEVHGREKSWVPAKRGQWVET